MRQVIIAVVLVLFGAAAGVGLTSLAAKSKMDKTLDKKNSELENSRDKVADLEKELKKSERQNKSLDDKVSKLNGEVRQIERDYKNAVSDLLKTRAELKKIKESQAAAESDEAQSPQNEVAGSTAQATKSENPGTNVPTVEYTVKDGDNFWNIAVNELGSGGRSNEIMKLNPEAAKMKYLKKGMKLRLPAK